MSGTVYCIQLHRYAVPLHLYRVVLPRTWLWCSCSQYCGVLPGTSLWYSCSSVLYRTSRYIAMVFLFISTVLYFQLHRYSVPLKQTDFQKQSSSVCSVLLPGTSLWCSSFLVLCCTSRYIAMVFLFIGTVLYFQVHRYGVPVHQYCIVLPSTSLWCSYSSVLRCTSSYIAMVFQFSTVLYFQVHLYGVPVQYCVVLPGTSLWCSP